jgi:hypothetical protein
MFLIVFLIRLAVFIYQVGYACHCGLSFQLMPYTAASMLPLNENEETDLTQNG